MARVVNNATDEQIKSLLKDVERYVRSKWSNFHDLDGLLDEARFAVTQAVMGYRPGGRLSLKAWVIWLVKNRCLTYVRYHYPRTNTITEKPDWGLGWGRLVPLSLDAYEGDLQDIICHGSEDQSFKESILRRMVMDLPDRERRVLLAYYWDGKTCREIADLQGVSWQWVHAVKTEGLARLREGIAQHNLSVDKLLPELLLR